MVKINKSLFNFLINYFLIKKYLMFITGEYLQSLSKKGLELAIEKWLLEHREKLEKVLIEEATKGNYDAIYDFMIPLRVCKEMLIGTLKVLYPDVNISLVHLVDRLQLRLDWTPKNELTFDWEV